MILLQEAYDTSCDEHGRIYAWRGRTVAEFGHAGDAQAYVDHHWANLRHKELRFFTGSASLLVQLNGWLDAKNKEVAYS